jgi:hypothetical protein
VSAFLTLFCTSFCAFIVVVAAAAAGTWLGARLRGRTCDWRHAATLNRPPWHSSAAAWRCSKCGEALQDTFDACWKCGTTYAGMPTPEFQPVPDDPAVPDPGPCSEDFENKPPVETRGADGPAEERLPVTVARWAFRLGAVPLVGCGVATFVVRQAFPYDWPMGRGLFAFEALFFFAGFYLLLASLLLKPTAAGWLWWVIGVLVATAALLKSLPANPAPPNRHELRVGCHALKGRGGIRGPAARAHHALSGRATRPIHAAGAVPLNPKSTDRSAGGTRWHRG